MKKSLLLLVLAANTMAATSTIDVIEATSFYGGEQRIKFSTTVEDSSKVLILPEVKARLSAIKKAKELVNEKVAEICTEGRLDDVINHDIVDCSVIDSKKNIVKCEIESDVMCNEFTGIKSKEGLRLKLGTKAASTACVDHLDSKYNLSDEIISNCNKIQNEVQFECVEILGRYNSIKVYAIEQCAKFENEHAINAMRFYNGEGEGARAFEAPTVNMVRALSFVDSAEEEQCFINKMKLSTINSSDLIRECTNEITETIQDARDSSGGFFDRLRNIFNR